MKMQYITSILLVICSLCIGKAQTETVKNKFIVDVPILDIPLNTEHNALGIKQFSPSMYQSLNWTKSVYEIKAYYAKRLFSNPNKEYNLFNKVWRTGASATLDYIVEGGLFYFPLSTAWLHEEFHRAVLNHNNVRSYNQINSIPFGAGVIPVNRVKDADLIRFKKDNNPGFVRMSTAGMEGQLEYINAFQKEVFFYNLNTIPQGSYWFNVNNIRNYLKSSADTAGDEITQTLEENEGTDIEERDFTGLDMVAWIYDLSNPDEAYEDRGVHPSGVGIRRYRLTTDLTADQLEYLEKMGNLQLLNIVSPHLFFINSIKVNDDLRFNFSLFHYLTSFGHDAGGNVMLEYKKHKMYSALHTYHNKDNTFYGLDMQLIDHKLNLFDSEFLVSPRLHVWTQPKDQSFFTDEGQLGANVSLKISKQFNAFMPYIYLNAKTAGWVASNVNLDDAFNFNIGVMMIVKE